IREAKAALEADAKAKAEAKAEQAKAGDKPGGPPTSPTPPQQPPATSTPVEATPEPKAQRNFTDPESRIMPDGGNKGAFIQAYNAQIAVDDHAQIIVAIEVTQSANDVRELVPMAEAIVTNVGELAQTTSADAGYFSKDNVEHPALGATNLLVPPSRQKHGAAPPPGSADPSASPADVMRRKLASPEGRALYKMRKAIVEPVF